MKTVSLTTEYWVGLGFEPALFIENPKELNLLLDEAIMNDDWVQQLACLNNPNLPLETSLKFVEKSDVLTVATVLGQRERNDPISVERQNQFASLGNLNIEVIKNLADKGSRIAKQAILSRPDLTPEIMEYIFNISVYKRQLVMISLLRREDFPSKILEKIMTDDTLAQYRGIVVLNPAIPQWVVTQFLDTTEPSSSKLISLLEHPSCPIHIIVDQYLNQKESWEVIVSNPNTPEWVINKIAADFVKNSFSLTTQETQSLVTHPKLSLESLMLLWERRGYVYEFNYFSENPKMPTSVLERELICDKDTRRFWLNTGSALGDKHRLEWWRES